MGTSMSLSQQEQAKLYYKNHAIPRKKIKKNKRPKY